MVSTNDKEFYQYEIVRTASLPMRYYFHILTDRQRLRDPDGEEFPTLEAAREEATQSARDLIAEELRHGRTAPSRWRIQIAHKDDTIVDTLPFAALLMGGGDYAQPPVTKMIDPEFISSTKATFAYARTANAEIRNRLIELRDNLQTLAQLNRAFTKHHRG
jgi:hypothetical protein